MCFQRSRNSLARSIRIESCASRKAASLSDYDYSESLRKLSVHWDDATLDRWLTVIDGRGPEAVQQYRALIRDFPRSRYAPDAWLELGIGAGGKPAIGHTKLLSCSAWRPLESG